MKRLKISAIAMLAAMPSGSMAQDFALDEITVTANRTATARNRTGVSASVISRVDQAAGQPVGIADAFARIAGVSVSQQGAFGSPASVRIRGADQRYIAVFIDGVRVTDPTSTETKFDFGMLPAAGADRIEVLRGSQSALWGGSAVAGVINITSSRPTVEGTQQDIQAEVGTYGTVNLRYGLVQKSGDWETALSLSHLQTDGFSAAAAGTEADAGEATRLTASLRYRISDTLSVGASAFGQKSYSEYDGYNDFFTALIDKDNSQTRDETGARLFAELTTGNTDHVFDVTHFRVGRDYDQEGDLSGFDGSRLTFGWQATTEVSADLQLVYGLDTMTEKARYTNLPAGVADTTISGGFVQALWAATPDVDIAATLRRDDHSSFGGFTTGRLALAWRPSADTTLRLAAATGFRAPSIDELFGDYPGSEFVGNPDLTPEESDSFEIGIEQAFASGATLSVTAFRLNIDNLITYDGCPATDPANWDYSCAPGTISTLQNVAGQSVRQGIELEAEVPVSDRLRFALAYTYTDARRPSGTRIGLVPYHDLSASLTADVTPDLVAGVTVKHVAGRLNDFASARMDDYMVVNATLEQDLGKGKSAYLRLENLFDDDYQTSEGYAASGRAVYVGLRASF